MYERIFKSVTSHALGPLPTLKLSHLLGPPTPSSVTYFMDDPEFCVLGRGDNVVPLLTSKTTQRCVFSVLEPTTWNSLPAAFLHFRLLYTGTMHQAPFKSIMITTLYRWSLVENLSEYRYLGMSYISRPTPNK